MPDFPFDKEAAAALTGATEPASRDTMRADLARAMGWTNIRWHTSDSVSAKPLDNAFAVVGTAPNGQHFIELPDPFTDAADSRALVAWLRSEASSQVFDDEIFASAICKKLDLSKEEFTYRDVMKTFWDAMTAPLPVIADAAWRAVCRQSS